MQTHSIVRLSDDGHAVRSESPCGLSLRLRREALGAVIDQVPVTGRDLAVPIAEVQFEALLRRGFPSAPPSVSEVILTPAYESGSGETSCTGFELEATNPRGDRVRCVFPLRSLAPVAARAARRLISEGVLNAGEFYYYDLLFEGDSGSHREGTCRRLRPAELGVPSSSDPVVLRSPLRPLLDRAEAVGAPVGGDHFPVFYLKSARDKAEHVSRKGGDSHPPIETGGVLIGWLGWCPEMSEFFAVVIDVLEAVNTEATTHTLAFSDRTWARIQAVMKAKQEHPSTRGQLIVGQTHGHSFLPLGGATPCADCQEREVCSLTTACLSAQDLAWCRAVFHAQPWQLSQIFGFNARAERVEAFFGQKGGSLVQRGYYVIEGDDPLDTGAPF